MPYYAQFDEDGKVKAVTENPSAPCDGVIEIDGLRTDLFGFTRGQVCEMLDIPKPDPADAPDAKVRVALAKMVEMMDSGDEPGAGSEWHAEAVAALNQ